MSKAKELFRNDFKRIRRKIEKYNKELADYVTMTGDNEVPDIECTVIGTSPLEPIKIKELSNGIAYSDDGFFEEITVHKELGEYWLSGEDELDDLLKYNRRRLRKCILVWKSDNPDKEMERDNDD